VALREQLEEQRPEHVSIETGFRWLLRDKEIAGGVLGGGLAYRFFFWILALTVLFAGGLGFASASGADVAGNSRDAGVTSSLASSIATAAEQSESGRWWLVLTGLFLVLWSSYGLLRALHLVHAAAWRITPPPLRNAPKAVGFVLAVPFVLVAGTAAAGWMRANAVDPLGLVATLGLAAGFGAAWLWITMRLPSPELPWTAFLPGAVLFAVGLEALHVFTAYFLQAKLANASELYGALGLATTALFYLFLVGRGVVWAAELNAVVWEARTAGRTTS
jgi:membrane protein